MDRNTLLLGSFPLIVSIVEWFVLNVVNVDAPAAPVVAVLRHLLFGNTDLLFLC